MRKERPYRHNSLEDLYRLAKEHWENALFLQIVIDELAQRTTEGARRLHDEVGSRIEQLRGEEAGETEPEPTLQEHSSVAEAIAKELARLRIEKEAAEKKVADLQSVLIQARDTIRWQERKLASVAAKGGNPLYRRVGLDEGCPDFVLKAVRTAYRKQLHPDARPAHEKEEAERRFKEAETVFASLFTLRKIRG
jgi:hypothetical protein